MRSTGPISLFSERQPTPPPTASLLLSVLAHGAVIGLVAVGIAMAPRINQRAMVERYTVRHLDLEMPDPPRPKPKSAGVQYPGPVPDPTESPLPPAPQAKSSVARQVAQAKPAPQTLIQPKLPPMVLEEKIPLPTVVLWQPENRPLPTIVPPPPKKPAASLVQPSVQPPNEELTLDRVAITPTQLALKAQPIPPTNSSPVVVQAPDQTQTPPQTTSKNNAPPTPTAIVSLSDQRQNGPVVLPPANQSASSGSSGLLGAGRPEDVGQADNGSSSKPGAGPDDANSNNANASRGNGKEQGSKPGAASGKPGQGGTKGDTDVGTALASASNGGGTVEKISLPRDGQFGAVIVGSSLEELYPEASELWSGRLAYTVYLHVGLAKSWILQYALPPAKDAATGGNAAHLNAPWPYTIIRPNLTLGDLNADALMVHGIVDRAGRFQTLAVAFPPRFPQSEFLLASLRQWEFRPAMQGGQPTAVEVLLIIPEESE